MRLAKTPGDPRLKILQLKMGKAKVVSDELRRAIIEHKYNFVLVQEPYAWRGKSYGMGLGIDIVNSSQFNNDIQNHLDELEKVLVALNDKRVPIATDANAKSHLWGFESDAKGVMLENFIMRHDLTVLNNKEDLPTLEGHGEKLELTSR